MAEQNQQKKRNGIVKRIFKWIGVVVLSILLIGAIVFQAPWKVTTLLVLILAACTILPKPYRKWFWLSAAAIVVILVIWIFLPEDNEGWRPYTFDALEAKYSTPPEENAATVYNQLLVDYNEAAFEPNFLDPNLEYLTRHEPWSGNDYPQVAEWIKGNENIIAKLIEASKFEHCRFPIVAEFAAYGQHIEILAPMRRCAFLLVCAANNDLAEGRFNQAIEKNLAVLQMGKHLRQQPAIIDMLDGIAIEALATNQFKRFVVTDDATEEHLNLIEKAVADIKNDWSYDLRRTLELEKLIAKNMFCSFTYEINQEGKVRFSRDPTAVIREQCPEEIPPLTFWQRKLAKACVILAYLGMPSTPKEVSKSVDSGFQRLYAMAEPDFDWAGSPKEFSFNPMEIKFNWIYVTRTTADMMASMLEEPYYTIHDSYIRNIAEQRGARIIIALRRCKNKTGHWPESLDELKSLVTTEIFIDPINGSNFAYKLTEENFTLYSKGKNNIDEGGKRDRWDEEKKGADDWLIWPRKIPKTNEKNADKEQHNTENETIE